MISVVILLSAIIVCICLSAFFSGSELAYSSANHVRLENYVQDGNRQAKRAVVICRRFEQVLSTILIGNNLVNIAVSSLVSVLMVVVFGVEAGLKLSVLGTVVITVLIIIFGETIPKMAAGRNPTKTAMRNSLLLSVFMVVFAPVVFIVTLLVKLITLPFKGEKDSGDAEESVEELQSIIETAGSEGILDKDDTDLLKNAIDFSETTASSAMTARVDVMALSIDEDWDDIIRTVNNSRFTRIPVYEESIDNIIGILHLNTFYQELLKNNNQQFDLRKILLKPCYAYKTMKLPSVLNLLKSSKQHLAIVTDEYSGTLGVISMEDVLEQLVGEIWDESDTVESSVVRVSDSVYLLDGDVPVEDFMELFGLDEDTFEADSETVGGYVVEKLDHFPAENESFISDNLKLTVVQMDQRRVAKVKVEILSGEKNENQHLFL